MPLNNPAQRVVSEYIWFERELIKSKAYRSLTKNELLVYQDFLCKRQMVKDPKKPGRAKTTFSVINNGEIVYPYKEAVSKGFHETTFRNSLIGLINKGFLDINHRGSGTKKGDMTTFFLSDRWREYDLKTKKAVKPPKKPIIKDVRHYKGWYKYNENLGRLKSQKKGKQG